MTRVWGTLLVWVAMATAAIAQQATPSAPKPAEKFTPWNGSFSHQIDIEVPDFRNLEPDLNLTYDSSRKVSNYGQPGGELGVGWSLSGLSVIERVSGTFKLANVDKPASARGLPAYGLVGMPADSFTLDGQELIPCADIQTPALTPSCAVPVVAGETAYTTRVESFLRIRRIGDTWKVTNTRGYVSEYSAAATETNPHRAVIKSTQDPRGNKVVYNWSCSTFHCSIDTIQYLNLGTTTPPVGEIKFNYETRLDTYTYASGKDLRDVTNRMSSIEVRSAGIRRHVYKLTYEVSVSTGLSRLISVEQFGKVDTTSLPATVLGYSNFAVPTGNFQTVAGNAFGHVSYGADFNGDGFDGDYINSCVLTLDQPGLAASTTQSSPCNPSQYLSSLGSSLDFDGDFRSDFVETAGASRSAYRNSATYNITSVPAVPSSAALNAGTFLWGDVTGDGLTDLLFNTNGLTWVSLGTSFRAENWNVSGSSLPASFFAHASVTATPNAYSRVDSGDFNGDRRTDFMRHWFEAGFWKSEIALSKGNGFALQPVQSVAATGLHFDNSGWLVVDANGDGLTDVVRVLMENTTSYRITPLLSLGNQFDIANMTSRERVLGGFAHATGTKFYFAVDNTTTVDPKVRAGNFDGDANLDLAFRDDIYSTTTRIVRNALASAPIYQGTVYTNTGRGRYNVIKDYSGDGLDDVFLAQLTSSTSYLNQGPIPDLLTSIKSPLGGSTTVSYRSSAGLPDTRLPFIMQVVNSITTSDGVNPSATTNFAYAGGAWNQAERQFMGFRTVTATLAANINPLTNLAETRPQVMSTYQQSAACLGKISMVEETDGAGTTLRTRKDNSGLDTVVPFTCHSTSDEEWLHEGAAIKKTRRERQFDLYGNMTNEIDRGVYETGAANVLGDETSTWNYFYPNPTAYLMSCPARTLTNGAVDGVTTTLADRLHYFDNAPYGTPPMHCEITYMREYSAAGVNSLSLFTYDAYGNVATTTDPVGNVTTTTYDATTNLYPVKVQSPIVALKTETAWDPVCGVPLKQSGYNGNLTQTPATGEVTTFTYDTFCRETRRDMPGGAFQAKGYIGFGLPNSQYVQVQRNPAGGQTATQLDYNYFDGFGRTVQTLARGNAAQPYSYTQIRYNQRGQVKSQSAPYLTGETPIYTTTTYDALDRPITVTHPDAATVTMAYTLAPAAALDMLVVTTTDETTRVTKQAFNANGQLTKRIKLEGATERTTEYRRDLLGRVVTVIDPALNTWGYSFDMLGRRTQVKDPDLGTWNYTYDAASRLVTQTDAKAQLTSLTYDAMSRVLTKTVSVTGRASELTTFTYDQARATYANAGQLTHAGRVVAAQTVATVPIPAVDVGVAHDYDIAGRNVLQSHRFGAVAAVGTITKTIGTDYWPDGSLKRKLLADNTWTGNYAYDLAGRLASIDNAAVASASEPDSSSQPSPIMRGALPHLSLTAMARSRPTPTTPIAAGWKVSRLSILVSPSCSSPTRAMPRA